MSGRNRHDLIAAVAIFAASFVLCGADRLLGALSRETGFTAISVVCHLLPLALIVVAPLGLLGRHSRWLYAPLFALALLVESAEWFSWLNFRQRIGGEIVGLLLGSSWLEIAEFFRLYRVPLSLALALLLAFALALFFGFRALRSVRLSKAGALAALVALAVAGLLLAIAPTASLKVWRDRSPAFNFLYDVKRRHREYERLVAMRENPSLPPNLRMANGEGVTGVFVLGESSTRNRWGVYGYPANTTPNLSRRAAEVVAFSDVRCLHSHTWQSTIYLLTTKTVERSKDLRHSLSQALRAAGCQVSLYSNQARWGAGCGEESFTFAGADPMVFMNEQRETNRLDGVLLKYVRRSLAEPASNRVVCLHVEGSHFPPELHYPHDLAPLEDAYDNSVWYTDYLLAELIRMLERRGGAAWVVYVSDHGETPSSDHWRDLADRDLWEIPFVVWTSREFRERFPGRMRRLERAKDLPLQSDRLLIGLLHFMGVEGLEGDSTQDFLSDDFIPPHREELWRRFAK